MKKNSLLNKAFVISLLLFLFSFTFYLITSFSNVSFFVESIITSFAIALLLGLYQEKLNITLNKIKKIKISIYYSLIYIILFIPIGTFLSYVGTKNSFAASITTLEFTGIYLTFGIALYLGLLLGCEISKSNETKLIKKFKFKHFSLIVLFIVLTLFCYKFYNPVFDALNATLVEHHIKPKKSEDKISIRGVESFRTPNFTNSKLEYYYYIPKSIIKNKMQKVPFLILVVDFKGKEQENDVPLFKNFAQQEGFVIIVPHFIQDEKYWKTGDTFNNLLADFKKKQHIDYKELYFFGNWTGAQFSEKYSFLYPEKVRACFLFDPNEITLPTEKQKIKFMITVGNKEIDGRKKIAKDFYNTAKKLGIDVKYKEYNTGNKFAYEQINDSILFFKSVNN